MWRILFGVAFLVIGAAAVYQLMVWDAHFLLLGLCGAVFGACAGAAFKGRIGTLAGLMLGFVAPIAYLPFWFVLDLPPYTGIDL
jgi:hypothetical protein